MADGLDARALLREADAATKAGDHRSALRVYARVARFYASAGFALKAVAVYRQVRAMLREHAPDEAALDAESYGELLRLYRGLGLEDYARALELEPRNDR
jgi:hypothetical protein